ncbi:MAG: hypothetical protein OXN21_12945 [Chloroflexota bacterium]|nr:hypothetical protein [Chloroflexota bacterium]
MSNGMSGAAGDRNLRFPAPSLPQDFPVRLERLEDRSGVSLEVIALSAGLPARSGRLWRVGRPPSEDELRAIVSFACAVPGGVAVLLLDASQPWPVRE